MNNDLDNIKFSTKSILLTDKQKDFIETLLDELLDLGDDSYNDIEYWKLSKQDATELIMKLKNLIDDHENGIYENDYSFEAWYEAENYGDR